MILLSHFSNIINFYFKNFIINKSIIIINNYNDYKQIKLFFDNNYYDYLYINDINIINEKLYLFNHKIFIINYDLFYNFINLLKYFKIIHQFDLIVFHNSNKFTKKLFIKYFNYINNK